MPSDDVNPMEAIRKTAATAVGTPRRPSQRTTGESVSAKRKPRTMGSTTTLASEIDQKKNRIKSPPRRYSIRRNEFSVGFGGFVESGLCGSCTGVPFGYPDQRQLRSAVPCRLVGTLRCGRDRASRPSVSLHLPA